jgi:hypothetical protein
MVAHARRRYGIEYPATTSRGCVEDVLRPRQPPEPLPRPVACETTQVHDDDAVGRLGLPIGLGVKGSGHVELGADQPHELAPKIGCEDRVAIRDDGLRNTM